MDTGKGGFHDHVAMVEQKFCWRSGISDCVTDTAGTKHGTIKQVSVVRAWGNVAVLNPDDCFFYPFK